MLLKEWLRHFLIIWAAINIFDIVTFLTKKAYMGSSLQNADGSPITIVQRLVDHNFYKNDHLYLLIFTFLVEINYQCSFKKNRWLTFFATSVATTLVMLWFFILTSGKEIRHIEVPLAVLFGYTVGYALLREFLFHRLYALDVRLKKSETELQVLRQQLNPHFFFNTLNYLYGTALQEDAKRTAEGIDVMSGMMRYTVTNMRDNFVPLTEEINFINQYIYLQKVRLQTMICYRSDRTFRKAMNLY